MDVEILSAGANPEPAGQVQQVLEADDLLAGQALLLGWHQESDGRSANPQGDMSMPRGVPIVVVVLLGVLAADVAPAGAARPKAHPVFVDDLRIDPADLSAALGDSVAWLYAGFVPREIAEPRFRLFDSPFPLLPGGSHRWTVSVAGTLDYVVRVPFVDPLPMPARIRVAPALAWAGGTRFTARWARSAADLPEGLTFDVQHGTRTRNGWRWTAWRTGTTKRAALLSLRCQGSSRAIRTRLRGPEGIVSGWSPPSRSVCAT